MKKIRLWIENTWYHHKFKIICATVVFVFATICAVQCASYKKPDIFFLYAGPYQMSGSEMETFTFKSSLFLPDDYNGNGSKNVSYTEFAFTKVTQLEEAYRTQKMMDAEIINGDAVLLLLSPEQYSYFLSRAYIVTFQSVLGYVPDLAQDDYSILLSDLGCASDIGLDMLPDDTLVCICARRDVKIERDEEKYDPYTTNVNFFEYMLTYGQ